MANLLAFQPDETIAEVITLKNYEVAPYLVLATKHGLVKKTKLTDFDSNRTGGIVAINLREDDELIDAALISADDDLLLVSRKAMSIRFTRRRRDAAADGPGDVRACSACGSTPGDELLAMEVVRDDRTTPKSWSRLRADTPSGPGSASIRCRAEAARACSPRVSCPPEVAWSAPSRCSPKDEIYAITSDGVVIRTQGGGGSPGPTADHGCSPDEPARRRQRGCDRPQRRRTGRAGVSMTQSPPDRGRRAPIGHRVRLGRRRADAGAATRSSVRRRPARGRPGSDRPTRRRDPAFAARRPARPAAHRRPRSTAAGRPRRRPAPPAPPARPAPGAAAAPRPRREPRARARARLQLRHINPWTVLKFSCVLSIALFFVWLIVVGVLYGVLDARRRHQQDQRHGHHDQRHRLEGAGHRRASSSAARRSSAWSTSCCSSR